MTEIPGMIKPEYDEILFPTHVGVILNESIWKSQEKCICSAFQNMMRFFSPHTWG